MQIKFTNKFKSKKTGKTAILGYFFRLNNIVYAEIAQSGDTRAILFDQFIDEYQPLYKPTPEIKFGVKYFNTDNTVNEFEYSRHKNNITSLKVTNILTHSLDYYIQLPYGLANNYYLQRALEGYDIDKDKMLDGYYLHTKDTKRFPELVEFLSLAK